MGNSPYVDYEVSSSKSWAAEEQLRYLPGMGTQADLTIDANGYPDEATYYHGDLIGSTMLLTDGVGQTVNTAAYTAFGEYIAPSGDIGGDLPADFSRYGYAGAHGYESGMMTIQGANPNLPPITLQHLGERWYQPALGRFVQRDPIGILGGANVYLYCDASPLFSVDPTGLLNFGGLTEHWRRGPRRATNWDRGFVDGVCPIGNPVGPEPGTVVGSVEWMAYCHAQSLGEIAALAYGGGIAHGIAKGIAGRLPRLVSRVKGRAAEQFRKWGGQAKAAGEAFIERWKRNGPQLW